MTEQIWRGNNLMVSDQYSEFGSAASRTLISEIWLSCSSNRRRCWWATEENSDPTGTNTTDVIAAYVGRLVGLSKKKKTTSFGAQSEEKLILAELHIWLLFFSQDSSALKIQEVNIDLTSDNSLYTYDSHWIWILGSQLTEPDFFAEGFGTSGEYLLTKISAGSLYPFSWKGSSVEVHSGRIS